MPYFVIAGLPDCEHFAHAIYVANYLQEHLPNFKVKIIRKKPTLWEKLLQHTNKVNKWTHTTSPIIWKELTRSGGKPYLIGGLSEFWEYVDDYYGLQSKLPKSILEQLVKENIEQFQKSQEALMDEIYSSKNVLITGAKNPIVITIIPELLKIPTFSRVNIYLHDSDPEFYYSDYMDEFMEDIQIICPTVTLIETIASALKYCELLIIVEDTSCKPNEDMDNNIVRNITSMNILADVINSFGPKHLRIILCQDGPSCLNATVLTDECHFVKNRNIVAVTADLGLQPLARVCREAIIDVEDVGAPPVWGFIGLNVYVDIGRAVQKCDIYRPFDRAVRSKAGSSLPLGTVHRELRFLNYITDEMGWQNPTETLSNITLAKTSGKSSNYAKTRALISLLKLWYSDSYNGEIISLGIRSDGNSYGIPVGMVFSQPCVFEDGYWRPSTDIPLTPQTQAMIENMIAPAQILMDEFSLGPAMRHNVYNINI